jgi:hypothetical protein
LLGGGEKRLKKKPSQQPVEAAEKEKTDGAEGAAEKAPKAKKKQRSGSRRLIKLIQ